MRVRRAGAKRRGGTHLRQLHERYFDAGLRLVCGLVRYESAGLSEQGYGGKNANDAEAKNHDCATPSIGWPHSPQNFIDCEN